MDIIAGNLAAQAIVSKAGRFANSLVTSPDRTLAEAEGLSKALCEDMSGIVKLNN